MKTLQPFEKSVIESGHTEAPGSGEFLHKKVKGLYTCKRCNLELFSADQKFDSQCGWPSFDEAIPSRVAKRLDEDGRRQEILCAGCNAHLGHVFHGEGFTPKNTRFCVNSVSLEFLPDASAVLEKAYFASGCFWGTQYFFARNPGVVSSRVGFVACSEPNPSYENICLGKAAGIECVEVDFDPSTTSYNALVKLFFETHNFEQEGGQGPDVGPQYVSALMPVGENQNLEAKKILGILQDKKFRPATQILEQSEFYLADSKHQNYYQRNGQTPYCHRFRKIF